HLFLFQQHNILCRALRRQRRDLLSQVAGQDASQALTVSQIRSPRRRRADDDRLGRTGVVAGPHAGKNEREEKGTSKPGHGSHPLTTFRCHWVWASLVWFFNLASQLPTTAPGGTAMPASR